jgi:hypothetical protein
MYINHKPGHMTKIEYEDVVKRFISGDVLKMLNK